MNRWDHRQIAPGEYVLRLNDVEVGMVTLLDDVRNQHERVLQIVASMQAFDEMVEHVPVNRSSDSWQALGWRSRGEHDGRMRVVKAKARRHPLDVQGWLRRQWEALDFAWPLTPDQMESWETRVRCAAELHAQDVVAEQSAIDIAAEPDEGWITTPAVGAEETAA